MYEFSVSSDRSGNASYKDLINAAKSLVAGESDAIANMANISALIWQYVPDLNWAGFYRVINSELVLGPFQGKSACIRIEIGKGVCGAAAESGETQRIADVHAFPGHIACDAESQSELVIPIFNDGTVIAVLDLDSPLKDRFTAEDQAGLEQLVDTIASALSL
ncbi:MAG: GAF domain-containing protein [Parasphingorhabdus sp.]